ncbi:hypothetical protein CWR53_12665 [Pseudomonas sp. SGAir0191]|uniref:hypothetical protein n=1 Tax=Pseudomonas sp. SGAir0191 TaxID=2217867 RepID=UPI000C2B59DD|nr:hypothetical protein [Pseudomonas sp. SGAir0191]AUA33385.1 hypothetical protein CWR53_12665 [Pseudomonas sp. SGAir0191]
MHGSHQSEADKLAIKAYELFMATHLEPDNPQVRAELIAWVQENPAHWRAFLALDQCLAEVKQLLKSERRGKVRRS